ncbi:MAG: hypothetical protein DCF13_00300 [Flavobacteriaceae bacterium]|nr:MAG: hypothetical protein DCF13_00300 [Flavobacteriaceae bacterium]
MGLTIHYKGKLNNANQLKSLIEDVKDVARAEKWSFFVFKEQFERETFSDVIDKKNLYGIMISPPKCEPLCITFLSNGRMTGICNYNLLQLGNQTEDELIYNVFTKTQYSSCENHIKLILLLDYLNKNYLIDFECMDEGFFWETRDEELLIKTFKKYNNLIDSLTSSIEMIPKNNGENIEDYILRMAEVTNKNLK